MTLPKKGQWWLNQDKDQLQITRVTRSDVFYNVPATKFHNLSVSYELRGKNLTGVRLRAGVRNIMNTAPPLSPGGYVAAAYNPDTRYWFFSIRKTF